VKIPQLVYLSRPLFVSSIHPLHPYFPPRLPFKNSTQLVVAAPCRPSPSTPVDTLTPSNLPPSWLMRTQLTRPFQKYPKLHIPPPPLTHGTRDPALLFTRISTQSLRNVFLQVALLCVTWPHYSQSVPADRTPAIPLPRSNPTPYILQTRFSALGLETSLGSPITRLPASPNTSSTLLPAAKAQERTQHRVPHSRRYAYPSAPSSAARRSQCRQYNVYKHAVRRLASRCRIFRRG
jgi:hypothetical protein